MPPEAIPPRIELAQAQPANGLGAVILGGAHGALAVARSLGRKGIPSVFITDDHPLPKLSRYVRKRFDWNGPAAPGAADWLVTLAAREGLQGWLLFPCSDADVHFVAAEHAVLSRVFRLMSCTWDDLKTLCDKQLLAQTARARGVDMPRAYALTSEADARDPQIRFPVVLKPATREKANAFTIAKAWRADDADALAARYREAAGHVGAGQVVVQEFIPGGGETQFSYAALWHGGRPLAELVARRTRQFPVEFSYTSTFVETTTCEPVVAASRRLLAPMNFEGLVEIEYKFDERDNCHKVMDVNPRAWSWLALAEGAGVDLPFLMFEAALGHVAPSVPQARPAAWIHATRDLLAAFQLARIGRLNVLDYLRSLRGKPVIFASFAADDPLPGIAELPISALRVLIHRLPLLLSKGEPAPAAPRPPQRNPDAPPSAGLPPAA